MISRHLPVLLTLGAALTVVPVAAYADRPLDGRPNARGCLPGPHKPGRTARMPGQAVMPASPWIRRSSVEAYPRCRYDSQEEADRAADRANRGLFGLPFTPGAS